MDIRSCFLEDNFVDGIHLIPSCMRRFKELKIELSKHNYPGRVHAFSGNTPVKLNNIVGHLGQFDPTHPLPCKRILSKRVRLPHEIPSSTSYVVSPKPLGVRYLLYCDKIGRIYMEDESQCFFKLDEKRTSHQIPFDTILDGVVARKVVRDGGAQSCNGEARGQLSFFIMDTTCVKEHELTQRPSLEYRISFVKEQIMDPGFNAISIDGRCVLELDLAKYEPLSKVDEYQTHGFQESFGYPIGSFLYKSSTEPYRDSKQGYPVFEYVNGN